ncbi:MAG TPA: hypothetical protein VFZ37_01760 [Jiangellaceae bacterium]
MQHPFRRAVAAAVTLVGAAILPACGEVQEPPVADIETPRSEAANGIDDLSPADALERVHEALENSGTFRVKGLMLNGSELDIGFVVGVGASGTIRDPDSKTPVEILAVGGSIYVTGDEKLLAERIGEDIDDTVAGKWLQLGAESLERYEVFADAERFAEAVLPSGEAVTMTGVRELRGTEVIGLMFEKSESIVWVAATGKPVPIQLEEKGASANTGVLRFAVPGGETTIVAPAEEEIVSVEVTEDSDGESGGDGSDDDQSDGDGGGSDG